MKYQKACAMDCIHSLSRRRMPVQDNGLLLHLPAENSVRASEAQEQQRGLQLAEIWYGQNFCGFFLSPRVQLARITFQTP